MEELYDQYRALLFTLGLCGRRGRCGTGRVF